MSKSSNNRVNSNLIYLSIDFINFIFNVDTKFISNENFESAYKLLNYNLIVSTTIENVVNHDDMVEKFLELK